MTILVRAARREDVPAGIFAANTDAVAFYAGAGFGQHGITLSKRPARDPGR